MFADLVLKNRSYRGYDESYKVSKEELLEMVDCARICPSGMNAQPLLYYLAWEQEEVAVIQQKTVWAASLRELNLPRVGHRPTSFIVICQDTGFGENPERSKTDVGIAAQTLLLKATEMGLGGCMIGNFNPKEIKEVLNLPEKLLPVLVVAIGKPDETIVLTEVEDGKTTYYRDQSDTHYVPKRKLENIVFMK